MLDYYVNWFNILDLLSRYQLNTILTFDQIFWIYEILN